MKNIILLSTLLLIMSLSIVTTVQAYNPLPFPVAVNGTALTSADGNIFATISEPLSANSTFEITTDAPMIIANVFPADSKGNVATGVKPEVIMVNNAKKFKLNQTMSNNTLKAGSYLMNIVAGNNTARVLFTIK